MKHGRRHNKLKEQTYGQRFRQDAEGYTRAYRPIDVAEPSAPAKPLEQPPEDLPLAAKLTTKEKKRLKWAGVDPDEPA